MWVDAMSIKLHVDRKLPSSEIYACSKNEAKSVFADLDEIEIHFGQETHFEFVSGVHHPPKLTGAVVAAATIERDGVTTLHFYPIRKEDYSDHEHAECVESELVKIRDWLKAEQAVPEVRVVSNRQLILESVVDGFKHHQVSYS